jgi:hypothetical protein
MTAAATADTFEALLSDFPAVVNASKTLLHCPSGDVEHHIVTKGPPLSCRFRRLDGEKLAAGKAEFLRMERVSSGGPTVRGHRLFIWCRRRTGP